MTKPAGVQQMKKPKRKPKFRVGQVVHVSKNGYHRVIEVWFLAGHFGSWRYRTDDEWGSYGHRQLRPLTAKEIGPRRELKQ